MNSSRAAPAGGAGGGAGLSVALPCVLAGLCVAGLAGNLLLLAVLAREARRGRSSPANALLLNLCAADLALALGCAPARIAAHARQAWLFGGFLCRATAWLRHGCLAAKSLSWAAAGQARYRHLLAPSRCPGWSGGRLAAGLAALWAAALLLPLPLLLFTRLEAGPPGQLGSCVFRPPADAAGFMDVFGKVYPLLACLAPSGFAWASYGRALRLQRAGNHRLAKPGLRSRRATQTLLGLCLLFQAMWLPEWVVWLWERHGPPGGSAPPALAGPAEVLIFLNGSINPAVFVATSEEFREGLRGVWRGLDCGAAKEGAGETPQALQDLKGAAAAAAAEKVLPDVEHFWKDRRNTTPGEESDPIPWEHQGDP